MGIFDRFKRTKEVKTAEQTKKRVYSIPSLDGKDEIVIFMPENSETVKHRNNELTQLIIAKIIKQREGDTIFSDYTDYVAFEMPKEQEINDDIMSAVMRQYERESMGKIQCDKKQYYLGRLIDNGTGWYAFANKSIAVQDIVNKMVEEQINVRNAEIEASLKQKREEQSIKEQQFRAYINATDYLGMMQRIKNQRKQNPTLNEVYCPNYEGKYSNYNGININTGDILRIRNVEKIGKDGSGTYLYSAYVKNTENENDVEFINGQNPDGYAVCFELQKRLEDVVRAGNTEEIMSILTLLSDEKNFQDINQLTYIGEIDKNGQVNHREKSTSLAIQMKIEEMKQGFAKRMQQTEKGRQD